MKGEREFRVDSRSDGGGKIQEDGEKRKEKVRKRMGGKGKC